jgi:GTP:adenosylcobinamide-phosphate guanylyltransferase
MDRYPALVLAGRRSGSDPLARAEGVQHRALLPVANVPMLLRVFRALRASPQVGRIAVSIDDPAALDAVAELSDAVARGELATHRSLESPSRSVRDAVGDISSDGRVLITTADHALLTPQIAAEFLTGAESTQADVAVGLVAEDVIRAAHPDTTRTYLRFADGGYSGANLFAFRGPAAQRAAEFWVNAEQFRKRPWRLASVFGPVSLLLFALRRLTLDAALQRASRAIGCEVGAVRLASADAAIDVDRPSDLILVNEILAQRESG